MKMLLTKALLLTVSTCLLLGLFIWSDTKFHHILATIFDKVAIMRGAGDRKVVFVGGSGLLAGLDSERVSTALDRPVANLGVFAGFGLSPLLAKTLEYARPGDVVVVAPELKKVYDNLYPRNDGPRWMLVLTPGKWFEIYSHNNTARYLLNDISELCRDKLLALYTCGASGRPATFLGRGHLGAERIINGHGDAKIPVNRKRPPAMMEGHGDVLPGRVSSEFIAGLNRYHAIAAGKGVRFFLLFPVYPYEEYLVNAGKIESMVRQLRSGLTFELLGGPADFMLPGAYFDDTVNHLDPRGRELRTTAIIRLLKGEVGPGTN
jgi:hypothetical protein